jgi:hypothetical protein
MSDVKELKLKITSFLGSERAYWQGNSLRVALPVELTEKLNLTRGKSKLFSNSGEKRKFLFFETDKGILLKVVDPAVETKLKDVLQFADFANISDDDLKSIFT